MDSIFIKLLVLLATAFWWFPILRTLCMEAWRVSTGDETPEHEAPKIPAGIERASQGWEAEDRHDQRLENSAWSIGRRKPVRRTTSFQESGNGPERKRSNLPTAFQRSRR